MRLLTSAMFMNWSALFVCMWNAAVGETGTMEAHLPERSFQLMSVREASKLLTDGYVGESVAAETGPLANQLAGVVNDAVTRIRAALLASGKYSEDDAPLMRSGSPTPVGDAVNVARRLDNDLTSGVSVWKLAMVGGPCAGKTTALHRIKGAIEEGRRGTFTFAVPEIATMLYNLGVVSHGTFAHSQPEEIKEYFIQSEVLQLALENIWSQGAAETVRAKGGKHAVLLTDRDAIDDKLYSAPLQPSASITWSICLREAGRRLGWPGLSQEDLVSRYKLGVIILQTLAWMSGKPNDEQYTAVCLGSHGTNEVRHESPELARILDDQVARVYLKAYPKEKRLFLPNDASGFEAKLRRVEQYVVDRFDATLCQEQEAMRAVDAGPASESIVLYF